jgi:hypothetical protein
LKKIAKSPEGDINIKIVFEFEYQTIFETVLGHERGNHAGGII